MTQLESNIHQLDSAYVPFPPFSEWVARASLDTNRWDRYSASVRERGSATPALLARARHVVTRAAALDTGALEGLYEVDRGFTYSVAVEAAAWETALEQKGKQALPLFEAQLHAYDFVLDLATRAEQITEAAVRQLHVEICRAQHTYRVMTAVGPQEQELPKGRYKVLPNHVLTRDGKSHSYAPVDVTPEEMARLMRELRTESFLSAHPIVQAAYAHYGLVVIHPFSDGNGRVARALASAFTYRAASIPIVILSEYKARYLDALEEADEGSFQAFTDFISARSLETLQLVQDTLRIGEEPAMDVSLSALERVYVTKGGFSEDDIDLAGMLLARLMADEIEIQLRRVNGARLKSKISVRDHAVERGMTQPTEASYRLPISTTRTIEIVLISQPPAQVIVPFSFATWLPRDAGKEDDLLLKASEDKFDLRVRIEEIDPMPSGVLILRIRLLAEQLVNQLVANVVYQAEQKVRESR